MSHISIDAGTRMGTVYLTVSDLARSERFYSEVLGMRVLARSGNEVTLGTGGKSLITLVEDSNAPARPRRTSGLYHFAIVNPSRLELAHGLKRLVEHRWPITGAS